MRAPIYSMSFSFHHLYRTPLNNVIREWKNILPYIQPCYAVSSSSSNQTISLLREHRIPMICETVGQVSAVNDYALTIEGRRFGTNEFISRKLKELHVLSRRSNGDGTSLQSATVSSPLWVYTKISHDGIEHSRQMFEHIWAHKYILKGIVFDIHNFADTRRGSLQPSIYSYKVALDYLFRNIVEPFQREYGIRIPSIMMDGRNHITRTEQLHELNTHMQTFANLDHHHSQERLLHSKSPEMRLIVDQLFDFCHK